MLFTIKIYSYRIYIIYIIYIEYNIYVIYIIMRYKKNYLSRSQNFINNKLTDYNYENWALKHKIHTFEEKSGKLFSHCDFNLYMSIDI